MSNIFYTPCVEIVHTQNFVSVFEKSTVDSKTKCNVLVFKSSRFKEESVNFASWIKGEASSAEEQLDQAIDSCTTLK